MIPIIKTLALPTFVVLPWVLMKLNSLEGFFQNSITNYPLLLILILLPSIIIMIRWVSKFLVGQPSHH